MNDQRKIVRLFFAVIFHALVVMHPFLTKAENLPTLNSDGVLSVPSFIVGTDEWSLELQRIEDNQSTLFKLVTIQLVSGGALDSSFSTLTPQGLVKISDILIDGEYWNYTFSIVETTPDILLELIDFEMVPTRNHTTSDTVSSDDEIQVSADPSPSLVGESVTISGWANVVWGNESITIWIATPSVLALSSNATRPTEQMQQFTVTSDQSGEFRMSDYWSSEIGTHRAFACRTGTEHYGIVEFEVATSFAVSISAVTTTMEAVGTGREAVTLFNESLTSFPEMPQKDDMLSTIGELEENINDVLQQLSSVQQTLNEMFSFLETVPIPPEVSGQLEQMAQNLRQFEQQTQEFEQDVKNRIEETRNAASSCRHWDQLLGIMGIFDHYMNFALGIGGGTSLGFKIGTLGGFCLNEFKSAVFGEFVNQLPSAVQPLMTAWISALDSGFNGISSATGLMTERFSTLTKYLINYLLNMCERYKGEIKGALSVEFVAGPENTSYLIYGYSLTGKGTFAFKKRENDGDIIAMEGTVSGWIHKPYAWIDLNRLEVDMGGTTTHEGFGIPDFIPRYFQATVKGEAHADHMAVELELPFTLDVDSYYFQYKYTFCNVVSGPTPTPMHDCMRVRIPGAEWLFTRIASPGDVDGVFEVPITADESKSLIEHKFERTLDYRDNGDFIADGWIEFKLENPPKE